VTGLQLHFMKQYRSLSQKLEVKGFDLSLLLTVLIITLFGIATIFSAVSSGPDNDDKLWVSQIIRLAIGLTAMAIALLIDYRLLNGVAYIFYAIGFVLLAIVLAIPESSGARRWVMGGAIQPSELARIILIITVAQYLSEKKDVSEQPRTFMTAGAIVLVYTFMIFMQPSLGYALTIVPVALAMFFIGGINRTYLILVTLLVVVATGSTLLILYKDWDFKSASAIVMLILMIAIYSALTVLTYYLISKTRIKEGTKWVKLIAPCLIGGVLIAMIGSVVLKDYQKARLIAFVDADSDPAGSGYHIIQSKIAIGSGGFFGQGYMQGTQNRLDFLPAQHTDFIFSVIAEEWGFIGSLIILALYFVLIMNGLKAATIADDLFGILLATGIVTMIATQVFLNLGVTLGLMPITGVPLPLMSYGGSSLLSTFICIGLLLNIRLRR
jgi:rod shape determining protein RodA